MVIGLIISIGSLLAIALLVRWAVKISTRPPTPEEKKYVEDYLKE
jgi:hypothetical protein